MIGRLVASFPPGHGGLSSAQVDQLVGAIDEDKLVQGRVGPGGTKHLNPAIRSGAVQWIGSDEVGARIFSHLYTLAVVANRERSWGFQLEGITHFLQGTRYSAEGRQHYAWHMDWGLGPTRFRKISVVCHLSESTAFEGGSLQLTNGAVPVEAVQAVGTVTVFPSFVMHRVTPVTQGTRLGAVAWVLGPTFR